MLIEVKTPDGVVPISRAVFVSLLENSVANGRAPYRDALEVGRIPFEKLLELSRVAQIPYPLFFAPEDVVAAQLDHKTKTLLTGISKNEFSMSSRSRVELRDIELIVKDLLHRQEFLKAHDRTLTGNAYVKSLGRPQTVADDARQVRSALGFDTDELKAVRGKGRALELLISRFEERQLFVSRSQQHYMPQLLTGIKFSGLAVRDKKIPYIFLTSGDAGEIFEPQGRKIFTLVLLATLVGFGKFTSVTYDDHAGEPITNREYLVTEEVLMPAAEVRRLSVDTLNDVYEHADLYKVTPSAFVMRAKRLRLIDHDRAADYFAALKSAYEEREESSPRTANRFNAVRRYAGVEFSRRMLELHDRGEVSAGDFCRVVCLNNIRPHQIPDFRAALEAAR